MKVIAIYYSLVLLCSFFTLSARLIPLENIISIAREAFGKPIVLEIEEKLLQNAKFQNNKVLVDEREASMLLNHYFSRLEMQRPMRRQTIRQPREQELPSHETTTVPLEVVIRDIYRLFGQQRQRIADIESKLLKHVEIGDAGELSIDENIASQIINEELAKKYQAPKVLDVIPLSGALRQLPLVQLNVNTQKGNTCGFHAMYNLKAIEDLVSNNQPITSTGVKEISRMYLDGYLAEIGIREQNLNDFERDDLLSNFCHAIGLKHFFFMQFFTKDYKIGQITSPAGAQFIYNGDTDGPYYDNQEAEHDLINSIRQNILTPVIVIIPGHYTAFAVMHKPGEQPFIIYMNSISGDGVNSVAMQEGSGEAAVATYLSNLIKNVR